MSQYAQPRLLAWTGFVVAALLLLDALDSVAYGLVVPAAAVAFALALERRGLLLRRELDRLDLAVIGGLYVGVVALFALAFEGFTTDRTAGLFLSFAAGLVLGVAGPVVYTVWLRGRPLATLGLSLRNLPSTVALSFLFAAVQFALALWGYDLPADAEDWVPLLVMSLAVGAFEAVFFRGFVQGRLEASLGAGPAVLGAAALYALYHVGYGMGGSEMLFLFGLGVTYALAYRLTENVLVLWPLLTPLGAFYNNLEAGDIDLPWASIAGFCRRARRLRDRRPCRPPRAAPKPRPARADGPAPGPSARTTRRSTKEGQSSEGRHAAESPRLMRMGLRVSRAWTAS